MPARDVITYVGPGPAGLSVATPPAAGQPVCEEETGEFRGPRLGGKKSRLGRIPTLTPTEVHGESTHEEE